MRLNDLLTSRYGILIEGPRDIVTCCRPDIRRPEYFKFEFLGREYWKKALLSIIDNRRECSYALAELDECRGIKSLKVDVPQKYAGLVLEHLALFKEYIAEEFLNNTWRDIRAYRNIADKVEEVIRDRYSLNGPTNHS